MPVSAIIEHNSVVGSEVAKTLLLSETHLASLTDKEETEQKNE